MKKRNVATLAVVLSILMVFPAFAGEWIHGTGGWWFQNSDGTYPAGGIYTIDNKNYAFDEYGYMVENDWYQYPGTGKWFYAQGSGELAQSQWVGDYYVGNDGAMMTDAWIDGYYVDSTGKWVEGATYVDPDIYAPEDIDISLAAATVGNVPNWEDQGYNYVDTSGYGDSAGITNWNTWDSNDSSGTSSSSDSSGSAGITDWYTWDSNLDQDQGSSSTSSNPKSIPDDDDNITVNEVVLPRK